MDGTALKCREQGAVENVSAVLAVGVNRDGYREILGMDVFTTENETGWTTPGRRFSLTRAFPWNTGA